jgi:hypothetical protein
MSNFRKLLFVALAVLACMAGTARAANLLGAPDTLACATDPACAGPLGGVSDILIVTDPTGAVFSVVAFGATEAGNFFWIPGLPVIPGLPFTVLLEPSGQLSDIFGVFIIPGAGPVLGFHSDAELGPPVPFPPGPFFPPIVETPGFNPGFVMEPGQTLTIPYSVAAYLPPGFTGFFVTDAIPEPETYALLLAGLGLLGFVARRREQKEAA